MMLSFFLRTLLLLLMVSGVHSFTCMTCCRSTTTTHTVLQLAAFNSTGTSDDENEDENNTEGAQLAAELFQTIQARGLQLEDDLDEDEDEEEEVNIPQGAINAFLGYETNANAGEKVLAGNVSLTDRDLYSAVKERVLDTAGGFVDFVREANEEDDDDDETESSTSSTSSPVVYEPPVTIPDPELTAGEVVMLVLQALLHNNVPTPNKGVQILFGFSSPQSQIKNDNTLTPAEYAAFLQDTEYNVLFQPRSKDVKIDKADYSPDGKRAFFTARLEAAGGSSSTAVNFILRTTHGVEEDSCWLIDSMLIRPQSMRRRRRR